MPDETPEIDLSTYAARRAAGVTVDVRERGEYADGHVPGARLIPMGQLASRLGELDPSTPVHVICASGNRSRAMTDLLNAVDFDAVSVAGGTRGWITAGHPVEVGL
ncbi:rhodanese-like domain-containing protein [Nocardioides panaciterrulae]|uniref:Rhodanese-related sulfurtransferase n=1 Tax=Nocardioides panaciterrulae TaxID=661492 RepID=A0A7Y9E4F5_9ACTN|nr:rhodanese-like domain-containing protein [Nocardioides panaciterrulae]NYD40920.1 rhodanese-related sulfurtransferase [Nocardioides panaciterrulae]